MAILYVLVVGLIVGSIARFLMPGNDAAGMGATILLGICGALLANFLGTSLGWYGGGEPMGILSAVIGSILILILARLFRRRDRTML